MQRVRYPPMTLFPQRGRLQKAVDAMDAFASTYSRGMNVILVAMPMVVRRLFGGLAWALIAISLLHLRASTLMLSASQQHHLLWLCFVWVAHIGNIIAILRTSLAKHTVQAKALDEQAAGGLATGAPCQKCKVAVCDKCIPRFDHHSPWMNACVGAHNQVAFVAHLALFAFASALSTVLAFLGLWMGEAGSSARRTDGTVISAATAVDPSGNGVNEEAVAAGWAALIYGVTAVTAPLCLLLAGVKLQRFVSLVSKNITSHEDRNKRMLTYFRGVGGFSNPFDGGVHQNWAEFMGMGDTNWLEPQGYTVMDIPGHPLRQQVLAQVRQFMAAEAAGKPLQQEQLRMIAMCRSMVEEDDRAQAASTATAGTSTSTSTPSASSPSSALAADEAEVKHHSVASAV